TCFQAPSQTRLPAALEAQRSMAPAAEWATSWLMDTITTIKARVDAELLSREASLAFHPKRSRNIGSSLTPSQHSTARPEALSQTPCSSRVETNFTALYSSTTASRLWRRMISSPIEKGLTTRLYETSLADPLAGPYARTRHSSLRAPNGPSCDRDLLLRRR